MGHIAIVAITIVLLVAAILAPAHSATLKPAGVHWHMTFLSPQHPDDVIYPTT